MTKKHGKCKEKNTDLSVSVECGFVSESPVETASNIKLEMTDADDEHFTKSPVKEIIYSKNDETIEFFNERVNFDVKYRENAEFVGMFNLYNIRKQLQSGVSTEKIAGDLKQFIIENKDTNPELIKLALSQLGGNSEDFYDNGTDNFFHASGYNRSFHGNTSSEILENFKDISIGNELHGWTCCAVANLQMKLLNECDIPAVMIGARNHTTCLYQLKEGEYVNNNYAKSYTISASNIIDAIKTVYHKGLGLNNNGYILIMNEKGSYIQFALEDEAMWGKELDKRYYNKESVFDHTIAQESSVNANINMSLAPLGAFSGEMTYTEVKGNSIKQMENTFSLGFKQSNVTSLADSSQSIGLKYIHKGEKSINNGKKYSELKTVLDVTKMNTNAFNVDYKYMDTIEGISISNPEQLVKIVDALSSQFDALHPSGFEIFNEHDSIIKQLQSELNQISETLNNNMWTEKAPLTFVQFALEQSKSKMTNKYDTQGKITNGTINDIDLVHNYEDYLIEGRYQGGDIVLQRRMKNKKSEINHYNQAVDEYNSSRQEYINSMLSSEYQRSHIDESDKTKTNEQQLNGNNSIGITTFVRYILGKEKTFLKTDNLELTNAAQATGLLGANMTKPDTKSWLSAPGCDARILAEDGIKVDLSGKQSLFSAYTTLGAFADLRIKDERLQLRPSFGAKYNSGISYKTIFPNNIGLSAEADIYGTTTQNYNFKGTNMQIQGSYKPNNSNLTIFGSASIRNEQQKLKNLGGFNEKFENVQILGISIGAQSKKSSVSLNYSNEIDRLNSTKNRRIFSVGATLNI